MRERVSSHDFGMRGKKIVRTVRILTRRIHADKKAAVFTAAFLLILPAIRISSSRPR